MPGARLMLLLCGFCCSFLKGESKNLNSTFHSRDLISRTKENFPERPWCVPIPAQKFAKLQSTRKKITSIRGKNIHLMPGLAGSNESFTCAARWWERRKRRREGGGRGKEPRECELWDAKLGPPPPPRMI